MPWPDDFKAFSVFGSRKTKTNAVQQHEKYMADQVLIQY